MHSHLQALAILSPPSHLGAPLPSVIVSFSSPEGVNVKLSKLDETLWEIL